MFHRESSNPDLLHPPITNLLFLRLFFSFLLVVVVVVACCCCCCYTFTRVIATDSVNE